MKNLAEFHITSYTCVQANPKDRQTIHLRAITQRNAPIHPIVGKQTRTIRAVGASTGIPADQDGAATIARGAIRARPWVVSKICIRCVGRVERLGVENRDDLQEPPRTVMIAVEGELAGVTVAAREARVLLLRVGLRPSRRF